MTKLILQVKEMMKKLLSSTAKRIALAYFTITILLLGYIWLHVPFSYLDETGGAATHIDARVDILVAWLLVVLAAFIIGPVKIPKKWLYVTLPVSIIVLLIFMTSCLELSYRSPSGSSAWIGWVSQHAFIDPFMGQGHVPKSLGQIIMPANFTLRGIGLTILSAGYIFRELNWYWVVVPKVDSGYVVPALLQIMLLNL